MVFWSWHSVRVAQRMREFCSFPCLNASEDRHAGGVFLPRSIFLSQDPDQYFSPWIFVVPERASSPVHYPDLKSTVKRQGFDNFILFYAFFTRGELSSTTKSLIVPKSIKALLLISFFRTRLFLCKRKIHSLSKL